MKKILICILLTGFWASALAQQCPRLISPANNALDVPVDATITWPAVDGIIGYLISLGTTPGGTDILNRRSAGLINSFTAPTGLPEDTQIYVTISLFTAEGPLIICQVETFRTMDVTTPPGCTTLAEPLAGETNVNGNTDIRWEYAPGATNYRLSVGTQPGLWDVVNDSLVGNVLEYFPPSDFPVNQEIYVRVIPENENGDAGSCAVQHFKTGIGGELCEPFLDPQSGQQIRPKPEPDFPDKISICTNEFPIRLDATGTAEGYRWYRVNNDNSQTLLSEDSYVEISSLGMYRYEVYNNRLLPEGDSFECAASQVFRVIGSNFPEITALLVDQKPEGARVEVETSEAGDLEYAIDAPDGPFQHSPVFENVASGSHIVYVRDQNGCGTRQKQLTLGIPKDGFPKFFTPNGDGINDYWQFDPPPEFSGYTLSSLHVFDRYGLLVAQVEQGSLGWDGTFNGHPLPANNYWYQAVDDSNNQINGYFFLKR